MNAMNDVREGAEAPFYLPQSDEVSVFEAAAGLPAAAQRFAGARAALNKTTGRLVLNGKVTVRAGPIVLYEGKKGTTLGINIDEAAVRAALEEKSVEAKRQLMSES